MITTDALDSIPTAPPPAAPTPAPETPAAPPADALTGEKAVKAQERTKKQSVQQRMAEATRQAFALHKPEAAAPAEAEAAAPATEATPEGETEAQPTGPVFDAASNRWRDPSTGNFVPAPEGAAEPAPTEQPAATATPTETPAPEVAPEETPEDGTQWTEVKLPAIRDGDEELTLETDDPKVIERIAALKNNGMRRQEFTRRIEGVESKESQFREFEATLQTAPELLVDSLGPAQRERFRNYLLAQDFDQIKPLVEQWYNNDLARQQALLNSQQQAFHSRTALDQTLAAQRHERNVVRAVQNLIPDVASPEDASDFHTAAVTRLAMLAQQGADVRPETVPMLLERDLKRFGFLPPDVPRSDQTPSVLPMAPVRSAPKQAPTAATVQQQAQATQQRLANVAKQRQAAAAIVPQGSVAAPVTQPPKIKSFADATKYLTSIPTEDWRRGVKIGG